MSMYVVPKPCKECFGSSPAALSDPVSKAPGSAALQGDTYEAGESLGSGISCDQTFRHGIE
jgi:hypothetical protein